MTGYEGSHQDWLEGQASGQLEREAYERERREDHEFDKHVSGPHWGWDIDAELDVIKIEVYGVLPFDRAVTFANAILSEVEIAQRGEE